MTEEEKDDWLDDLDSPEDKSTEFDQSDIDALLAGSGDSGSPAAAGPGMGETDDLELDQSSIDALLSGSDEPLDNSGGGVDLDQSDIEALLASPKPTAEVPTATDPDQDEIDKLFSDVDTNKTTTDENQFSTNDIDDFNDVFGSPDSVTLTGPTDFDAEEFKLDADIPDIPAFQETNDFDFGAPQNFENTTESSILDGPTTVLDPGPDLEQTKNEPGIPAKGRNIFGNRKIVAGIGAGLALLLIVAGAIFFKSSPKPKTAKEEVAVQPPVVVEKNQKPAEPLPPPLAPPKEQNAVPALPTVNNLDLTMPLESTQLTITLSAVNPGNAPLEYEFQDLPEHGQLSGHAPNLVYIPKADYSGPDCFTVRATDGKNFGPLATIKITRQPPVSAADVPIKCPPEIDKTKAATPKQDVIQARDSAYVMTRSKGQIIDWKRIWSKANSLPYDQDVKVDILSAPRHGSLHKINDRQTVYKPEQTFKGTDTIRYRFTLGKLESTSKMITVRVNRINKAPAIHLQPVAPVYSVADTVVLDASQTTDDARSSLAFEWEQLGGVPVLLRPLNREGSLVSFVAPSTFNSISNQTLLFKVTVTNQSGAHDTREIAIQTKSLHRSAIWRGNQE
jgi:hypothetical protein